MSSKTPKSQPLVLVRSETDIFTEPGYDCSILSTCTNEYHPTSTITQTAPIEFFIQGNDQQYIDFSKTKLKITCRIRNPDGTVLAAGLKADGSAATLNYAPANYLIASAFDRVSIHLNETEVTPKNSLYQYQAYLETLLSYGMEYKQSQAEAGGFFRVADESLQTDAGYLSRKKLSADGDEFELIGRPHGEMFNQTRYLIPGIDARISFHRASSAFCVEQHGTSLVKPQLEITSAVLYIQKVNLLPSVQMSHLKTWQSQPCVYPGKRVEMKSYGLPKETSMHTNEHLLTGLVPDRLIIGLVKTKGVQGDYGENPFNFQDFDLSQIVVTCNTESPTQHVINVDRKYANAFMSLFDSMGITNCDNGLDIRLAEYSKGKALFGFDLRNMSDGFSIPRHGNVSIQLKFKKQLSDPVTVIVYPEYPSVMYINNNKQVTFKDYVREY